MSAPADSSSQVHGNYDVFLSFRGTDTRKIIIGPLLEALRRNGLKVFIDNEELAKGNVLGELLKAIEASKISLVVLSENFANSKWCLLELERMVELKETKDHIVLPIFYKVDPSHVRNVSESFSRGFEELEHNSRGTPEERERWKSALRKAGNFSGWCTTDYENDFKLIEDVINSVMKNLSNFSESKSNDDLVGMDSHIRKMKYLLDFDYGEVGVVGIWGMGGLGKTTIAKAVYEDMRGGFHDHCFLYNVKEDFKRRGEAGMQAELLHRITGDFGQHLSKLSSRTIMERLSGLKVFLVLDDVDSSDQIDALLGKRCSFGGGSRIIITTRDRGLLREFNVYEPEFLSEDQSLELFKKYAFRTITPSTEYDHLLNCAVKYARGLPLALKVLGASLFKKSVHEWEVEFEKIRKCQHLGVEGILRTTFDGLDRLQKTVLLDIACFFKEMKKEYAAEIMEACGFFPISVLPVLVDRALVTISGYYDVLKMHDLLLDMAFGIVSRESSLSRLTNPDEIEDLLSQDMDTRAVESIDLDLYHLKRIRINAKAFLRMTKLRLVRIRSNRSIDFVDDYYGSRGELYHLIDDCKQQVTGELKFLSHELRCLIWHGCPLKSLPFNFNPKHLVDLDMRSSRIKQLWKGTKVLKKLKYIDLSLSVYLKEMPDLTEAAGLEKVNLEGCTSLLEVHSSISNLKKLLSLNLKGCKELKVLPDSFSMTSLTVLELSGCSSLEKFPDISEVIADLPRLCLDKTSIKELPPSIVRLRGLVTLSLKDCRELESLPRSICRLQSLRYVTLSGCSKFKVFPEITGVEDMKSLTELHLDGTCIEEFLPSIALKKLDVLSLGDCKKLKHLPNSIYMESLNTLVLSGCSNLQKFPMISERMSWLYELHLDDIAIEELPQSIENIWKLKSLSLTNCGELKCLPISIYQFQYLSTIIVSGCSKFNVFPQYRGNFRVLQNLVTLRLEECRVLGSLPSSICKLQSLRFLSLSGCSNFEVFPEILEDMEELRELHLDGTSVEKLPQSIQRLKRIMLLNMSNCRSLVFLPDSICNFSYLTGLTLSGCLNLHDLPKNLGNLDSLVDLQVQGSGIKQPINSPSQPPSCLVGMDRHFKKMEELLCLDQEDNVIVVGICGTDGIGKTTIAKALYDKIASQFDHHCFLENVKAGFAKHRVEEMQEELLTGILNLKAQSLSILNGGSNTLAERLGMKKVLVVLDDIDDKVQIEILLGNAYLLGGGSRIIVTTRKDDILSGSYAYRPQLLDVEAVKLFRHFAFRTIDLSRKFSLPSKRATEHAQVPLDFKVWGAFLSNRSLDEWEYLLTDEHGFYTVNWVLSELFKLLHDSERNILVDVAWFFEGMNKEYAAKVLHSCGLFPYSALRGLIDKSLVSISERDGIIKMHDSLYEIVRDHVRHEDEHDPGNRSRLEGYQGIRCLSTQDQVTKRVEVITVDLSNTKEVYFSAEAFVVMKKLRLLQIYDDGSDNCKQHLIGEFEFISHELRCLIWHRCPLKSLPSKFNPKSLVDLDMRFSGLEQLWKGTKLLKYLTFINLSHSRYLMEVPDLTTATNLEKLVLDGCTSLEEVHPSVWDHENLIILSLKGCEKLKYIPATIHMKSLKTLNLSGCHNLQKFPEISDAMMELENIGLDKTAIKELPSSIERLQRLNVVSMRNCTSLISLPESICGLAHLTFLNMSGCSKLYDFPDGLRNKHSLTIEGLEELTPANLATRRREMEDEILSDEFFSLSEHSSEGEKEID